MERDERGRFKKGTHWRPHQKFREKEYLIEEYVVKGRSANDLAREWGVTPRAICNWLRRNGIARRTPAEDHALRPRPGMKGKANPMYGKRGKLSPMWKGGHKQERQRFYGSEEWKRAEQYVWRRDKATCQRCRKKRVRSEYRGFHIHHIASFTEFPELRAWPKNLLLLCAGCHRWVHSKENQTNLFILRKEVVPGVCGDPTCRCKRLTPKHR